MDFKDKVAIVTGAGSGMGREVAKALLAAGAKVVVAGRREEKLKETLAQSANPAHGLAVPTDVSRHGQLRRLVEQTVQHFGRLEVLVNNAGVGMGGLLDELSPEEIANVIQVNLTSPLWLTRLALPELRKAKEALVVNVSSMAGMVPVPFQAVYAASKFGVRGFSASLGRELAGTGVKVLAIYPAVVDTVMVSAGMRQKADEMGMGRMDPAVAGRRILEAMRAGQSELLLADGKDLLLPVLERWAPSLLTQLFAKMGGPFLEAMRDSTRANRAKESLRPLDEA
jgi:NAD(P)-dependent dehydrogenase (short-subunit alcohol dehydrogenase family)